jgi:hypothetical protein
MVGSGAVGVETPVGIDRARHHELAGRGRHVWWRRIALSMIAAIPALALLNVFGQHASTQTADSLTAQLSINSPAHVRGGLVFTTEITIIPRETLKDAQLYLDNGWFQGMTLNALQPTPSTETAQGPWQVLDFGKLPAATAFHIWIAWQVNPTNTGRHSQDVALYNGGTQLMIIHRTITVFP